MSDSLTFDSITRITIPLLHGQCESNVENGEGDKDPYLSQRFGVDNARYYSKKQVDNLNVGKSLT
jgi:hypothetical protein